LCQSMTVEVMAVAVKVEVPSLSTVPGSRPRPKPANRASKPEDRLERHRASQCPMHRRTGFVDETMDALRKAEQVQYRAPGA
jgi:hypothetical protein